RTPWSRQARSTRPNLALRIRRASRRSPMIPGNRFTARESKRGAPARAPVTHPASERRRSVAHRREEHDLAQAVRPGEQHDQAVDAEPDAAGGRHAGLEGLDVVEVHRLGLFVAAGDLLRLLLEAAALLVRVVELREGVRDLKAADVRLPALD